MELESRIDQTLLFAHALFYERHTGATMVLDTLGAKFILTSFSNDAASVQLVNGSVLIVINGLYYLSNTDQTEASGPTDFHIEDRSIIIHDTANGGTIDIEAADSLGIYFQKQ